MLSPLVKLTSIKQIFKWTRVEQDVFEKIKRMVERDTLLTYPYFIETFKIHTDAISFQLGTVMSQKDKPIAF